MTDKLLIDRSVVEQALEAFTRGCPPDCKDGMTDSGGVYPWGEPALIRCPACQAFDAFRAALGQPQDHHEQLLTMVPAGWKLAPSTLTDAQPRQPLTDDERQDVYAKAIKAIDNDPNLSWRDAIVFETERAHGIVGE